MILHCDLTSDVGMKRTNNEDIILFNGEFYRDDAACTTLALNEKAKMAAVVADGMGGHAGGEFASELAVQSFQTLVETIPDDVDADMLTNILKSWVTDAHFLIQQKGNEMPEYFNMGTTLVGLLFFNGYVLWVNVGDSRIYDITSGSIRQLTRDHSYVQHLVDIGQMSAEEARVSPVRNVITRAVGIDYTVRPDLKPVDISIPPDGNRWFLLCSDGLSGCIGDDIIHTVVRDGGTLEEKASGLVGLANAAGGPDNITVLLVEL